MLKHGGADSIRRSLKIKTVPAVAYPSSQHLFSWLSDYQPELPLGKMVGAHRPGLWSARQHDSLFTAIYRTWEQMSDEKGGDW